MFKFNPITTKFDLVQDLSPYLKLNQTTPQTTVGTFTFPDIVVPTLTGGTAVGSNIIYKSTTGVGTPTGIAHQWTGGTNGGTVIATMLNNGNVGIGTTNPGGPLHVFGTASSIIETDDNDDTVLTIRRSEATTRQIAFMPAGYSDIGGGSSEVYQKITLSGGTAGIIDAAGSSRLLFNTNGTTKMTILANGNVGIGTTSPTAVLHLKAGTATASTAPLKFTSGTNLTTPEAGAMEFSNDRLYFTNVATRRALDRTSDVALSTVTVTNTTTETTVFTGAVPANSLKAGNILKLVVNGSITSASAADTVILNVKIGGVTIATVTSAGSGALSDVCWHATGEATLRSVGATGSMAWHFDLDVSDASDESCGVDTVDTTTAEDVTVTATWNNAKAGNIFTLEQGFLEYKN